MHTEPGLELSTLEFGSAAVLLRISPKPLIHKLQFSPGQIMNRSSIPLIALGLLTSCTTAPPTPLTADNPANPSAPEATVRPPGNVLGVDDLTKKSRRILAQAAKQQQQWDQSGPVSADQQSLQMQNMPGMQMPQQQPSPIPAPPQYQIDQMPGMTTPKEQSQPLPTPNN